MTGLAPVMLFLTRDVLLIDDNRHTIAAMRVEPGYLILLHVDTAMTACTSERLIATSIIVRVVGTNTIIYTPPAIVQEIASTMILHREIDVCIRIPER